MGRGGSCARAALPHLDSDDTCCPRPSNGCPPHGTPSQEVRAVIPRSRPLYGLAGTLVGTPFRGIRPIEQPRDPLTIPSRGEKWASTDRCPPGAMAATAVMRGPCGGLRLECHRASVPDAIHQRICGLHQPVDRLSQHRSRSDAMERSCPSRPAERGPAWFGSGDGLWYQAALTTACVPCTGAMVSQWRVWRPRARLLCSQHSPPDVL